MTTTPSTVYPQLDQQQPPPEEIPKPVEEIEIPTVPSTQFGQYLEGWDPIRSILKLSFLIQCLCFVCTIGFCICLFLGVVHEPMARYGLNLWLILCIVCVLVVWVSNLHPPNSDLYHKRRTLFYSNLVVVLPFSLGAFMVTGLFLIKVAIDIFGTCVDVQANPTLWPTYVDMISILFGVHSEGICLFGSYERLWALCLILCVAVVCEFVVIFMELFMTYLFYSLNFAVEHETKDNKRSLLDVINISRQVRDAVIKRYLNKSVIPSIFWGEKDENSDDDHINYGPLLDDDGNNSLDSNE